MRWIKSEYNDHDRILELLGGGLRIIVSQRNFRWLVVQPDYRDVVLARSDDDPRDSSFEQAKREACEAAADWLRAQQPEVLRFLSRYPAKSEVTP